MKIVDKLIFATRYLNGTVSVNGSSEIDHEMEQEKIFHDSYDADKFINDDLFDESVFEEEYRDTLKHSEIYVESMNDDSHVYTKSIDEIHELHLERFLSENPNFEVKEMKYEIDGVKAVKKILIEKEKEVA